MTTAKPQVIPVLIAATSPDQVGRELYGIPVVDVSIVTPEYLREIGVYQVVFCVPNAGPDERVTLFNYYRRAGISVKVFDFPLLGVEFGGENKKMIRDFDIEELLFRKPVNCLDSSSREFYGGKTVLITGGGGSIGSELCRQLAALRPRKIIILDVYENGAYDLKTELAAKYGSESDIVIEILSVCNLPALERVFAKYRPDIVLHAAAHKHVPLMEHNCAEAVVNNVFGTLNVVKCAEKYEAERFLMVSTDKAVNPTNVMGATKRMCEMIVMSHAAKGGKTSFCATRFGNVLGSSGSVIPLFKRQIAAGGPLTVTDKRVIRYFMTIPEASQLVLRFGQMAENCELFVLDMGKPVRILYL
ncbi:MAG: polysaccharide biosynthesis protein, partial [Clostridia bacterium]|nr:polysaccharide biosynthesis protein [Clostridia bacterium]